MAEASGKSSSTGKVTLVKSTKSGKKIRATATNVRVSAVRNRAGQRKAGL